MPAPNQKMVFGSVRFLIVWLCSVFALLGLGFAEAFVSNPVTLFQTKKIGLSYTNPRVLPLHSMYSLQMSSPAEATPSFGSGDKNSPSQGEILKSYPSSNGRESGWRFDLGHVDVKPGFVSVPPTPGAGGEALKKLSTADLRHGESNEKTNTETSRSKPLFSRVAQAGLMFLTAGMMLIGAPGDAAARSGGRIRGGSFRAPSARSSAPSARSQASSSSGRRSPSSSSSSSSSSVWGSPSRGPNVIIQTPPRTYYQPSPWLAPSPLSQPVVVASRSSGVDDLIVAGGLALGTWSVFRNNLNRDGSGPDGQWIGPSKFTVAKVTVGLHCDSRGPNSLLGQLSALANDCDETSEAGRQALASDVCLALLRQQSQWHSAGLEAESFSSPSKAEAALSRLSLQERAKIDRETVNKINGRDRSEERELQLEPRAWGSGAGPSASGAATEAVVTLVLGFEGDLSSELLKFKPSDPNSLKMLLQTIASASAQPDSLQVAEVVWSPEEPWETLLPEDVVGSHPELTILQ